MKNAIELKNISYHYPNSNKGLENVSLKIPSEKKTAVLGLNGAGKSTLFLTLCGVLKPQTGNYLIENQPFKFTKKERTQIGQHIGYVFQDPEIQLFAPTVYDDIAFGIRNQKKNKIEIKNEVEKYLEFLNITHLKDNAPHELSYGQKKLVAIAGVLVMNPKILILDEPFAWLDIVQQENMKKILNKLYQQKITIIFSTHNLDFAGSWADYAIFIKKGKCTYQNKIEDLNTLKNRILK